MKSNTSLKISILVISLLICISFKSFTYNNTVDYKPNKNLPQHIRTYDELRCSSSWTISNIYINNNWSDIANDNDWCNYIDGYYVIENVTITGGVYAKNGIHIENTTENFIIRNCQINEGIALKAVQNGLFIGNNVTFGQAYLTGMMYQMGIYMGLCSNISLSNNFINDTYNTDYGLACAITSYKCDNITIFENFLSTNHGLTFGFSFGLDLLGDNIEVFNNTICDTYIGIILSQCSFGKIVNNNISNSREGLYISGDNHIIANNTIKKSYEYGIKSSGCDNNTFSYNSIQNENECGFYFYGGNYNIISNNTIEESEKYGIYLESSNHSLVTGNRLINVKGCIKEINCVDNIFNYNICHKIPTIFGYFPWIILGILIITTVFILKIKIKR